MLRKAEHLHPQSLLVTTFTNKAALELKDRIQQKLPGVNVELMQVSTIHSFSNLIECALATIDVLVLTSQ
jgi:superfamily I DNA/RNA helicase